MELFLSALTQLAADNFAVLIFLYWLALYQPKKILLYIALALAVICTSSFFVHPEVYVEWLVRWILDPLKLLPTKETYGFSVDCLPAARGAVSRGYFKAWAFVVVLYMLIHPYVRLKNADKPS